MKKIFKYIYMGIAQTVGFVYRVCMKVLGFISMKIIKALGFLLGKLLSNMRFVRTEWGLGIVLTLFVLLAFSLEFYPLRALEYVAYDFMAGYHERKESRNVVIVAIDEKSTESMGRWPWPRKRISEMVSRLSKSGARVVGADALYPERDFNPSLDEVRKLAVDFKASRDVYRALKAVERRIDSDNEIIKTVKSSGKVVMPLLFTLGEPVAGKSGGKGGGEKGDDGLPRSLKKNSDVFRTPPRGFKGFRENLLSLKNPFLPLMDREVKAVDALYPFDDLASNVRALGHVNRLADGDGTVRSEPLLIYYKGRYFPSFGLQVALKYLRKDIKQLRGMYQREGVEGIRINNLRIPSGADYRMLIKYNSIFPVYSFADVMEGKASAKTFRNKAVLIGYTGPGAEVYGTPSGEAVAGIELTANVVENIIKKRHIARPTWAFGLEVLLIVYFGVFISFILPRVKPKVGALLIVLSLLPVGLIAKFLFASFGYWLMVFSPSLLLVLGYLAVVLRAYVTVGEKGVVDAEGVESSKMLGLTFQGQGMLDMAFEKFMKCPVEDKSVKGLLYNLGQDFERKRMFGKAKSVYEYISQAGRFKDIKERIQALQQASGTMSLGPGASKRDSTVLLAGAGTKPTLGRYEVTRELGRGAMGTVYLGRDPKINRDVAIKTLRYDEIEEDQAEEVKRRFFQEAEAAGRLSHPNIMTIYDAGEEHDLAYMAMEFLAGSELTQYCQRGKLLPAKEVMRIVSDIAGALNYAHKNGVVHRDIKPANIMILDDGTVKVTDFGIARVVESSKTHTGMIMGTPSYMSPEQVAGEKVEGPSDLFSLGVVFYELLTGQKPFTGESIAAIMYSISRSPYSPVKDFASKAPDCSEAIVDKLLNKNILRRYKTGAEVVKDIVACMVGKG